MLHTQGIAPLVHTATAHLLPGTVVVVGSLLLLKAVAFKSWHNHRQKRKEAENKQAELEQKLEQLQNQYDSLKETNNPKHFANKQAKTANPAATSSKHLLYEQIINENIAIREAANA